MNGFVGGGMDRGWREGGIDGGMDGWACDRSRRQQKGSKQNLFKRGQPGDMSVHFMTSQRGHIF